jgi:dimethylargininase
MIVSMEFSRAIVRLPGASFADGLTMSASQGRPDLHKALEQHAHYCQALRACGLELTVLAADEQFPDGTFVEDTAVIAARVAVLTRPGAPTRVGELAAVAAALRQFRPQLQQIDPPGSVDGGDICQAGNHFFIGVSARTNSAGAAQLAEILACHGYSSSLVDIRGQQQLLHLKSGLSYLGERRLVMVPGVPRTEAMSAYQSVEVDAAEAYDLVLLAAGYTQLAARLGELGYAVQVVDMSEFRKMDGGLSCLSLRF